MIHFLTHHARLMDLLECGTWVFVLILVLAFFNYKVSRQQARKTNPAQAARKITFRRDYPRLVE